MPKTLPARGLAALTALATVALLSPGTPAHAIVGGRTVQSDAEYPAVGRLQVPYADGGYELCTAILIRTDVALTARHCFEHGYKSKNGPITLRFGSRMATTGGQVREADEVVRADGFDLALIHFPSVSGIRPLPMADKKGSSALYQNGTVGLAVGWGGTASGKPATQLQEGAMKVEDQVYTFAQTMTRYDYLMKASPYRGKIAGGDSGGPLINEHVVNGVVTQTVIGVVSQGSKSDAAAYTKVGSVQPWIREYLNKTAVTVPAPVPPAPRTTGR